MILYLNICSVKITNRLILFKTSFSTVKKPPVTQRGGGKQEKA